MSVIRLLDKNGEGITNEQVSCDEPIVSVNRGVPHGVYEMIREKIWKVI